MTQRHRAARFAAAFVLSVLCAGAAADATLQTVIAQHVVVPNDNVDNCVAKARDALTTVMQNANETDPGSGQWVGVDHPPNGAADAFAVIECHPIEGGGYSASFTCSAQTPTYADGAAGLCTKLVAAFSAPAPSPSPASGATP